MKPYIDFDESLKDSPKFRAALEENEHSIHGLEVQLEKLSKVCSTVVDTGKTFTSAMGSLINGFEGLSPLFKGDEFVTDSLNRLCCVLSEIQSFLLILLDQAQRSIVRGIQSFVKEDIKKAKETKKVFDKISDDLDSAYQKNGALFKTAKAVEVEEVENVLLATQSCFSHTALDYAFQINVLQSKRRFCILGQLATFMNAQYAYFKQGTEVLNNIEPYLQELNSELDGLQEEFQVDKKEMEERHTLVQRKRSVKQDNILEISANVSNVMTEGYLFKRASNAFKTWNRRWFTIQNNKLYYQKRSKDVQTELIDLRLCTVKSAEDLERRFCFAIVCPTRCLYLQADNNRRKMKWIESIQVFIAKAINSPASDIEDNGASSDEAGNPKLKKNSNSFEKLHPQYQLQQIRQLPGNEKCADCNSQDPKWASVNIGVIVCIECSGIHRSLGVHISKVRSVTLDQWEPESLKLMSELGNNVVNQIFEDGFDDTFIKPTPASPRAEREAFIKAKYVEKRFVRKIKPRRPSRVKLRRKKPIRKLSGARRRSFSDDSDQSLTDSPEKTIIIEQSEPESTPVNSPAKGTENDVDGSFSSGEEKKDEELLHLPPNLLLYRATSRRNIPLMALAVANGADVNFKFEQEYNMTALHQAAILGCIASCEFLLQNGANLNTRDGQGRGVLHHAALHGNTALACMFLKRGANQQSVDENGEDALKIALKSCHADIVTLLRLARLNDEMRESDLSIASDETFTNVVRDFSNMATQNPEKLKRNFQRNTNV